MKPNSITVLKLGSCKAALKASNSPWRCRRFLGRANRKASNLTWKNRFTSGRLDHVKMSVRSVNINFDTVSKSAASVSQLIARFWWYSWCSYSYCCCRPAYLTFMQNPKFEMKLLDLATTIGRCSKKCIKYVSMSFVPYYRSSSSGHTVCCTGIGNVGRL